MKMSWSRGAPAPVLPQQQLVGFVVTVFLFMIIITTSYAEEEEEAVIVLMRFKKTSVSFDPKNFLSDWTLDSPSPCSWNGVTCSGEGHVISLNLTNGGIVGTLHLPTLITSLPYLQHLLLHSNYFTKGNFSVSVSSFCNLVTLDLSNNNFSGKFPFNELVKCHSLSYLNLSHNLITGATETGFGFGASLVQLDLSRNQVSENTFLKYTLGNCQSLVLVNFSDNKISGQLSETTVSCTNLSTLDLSYNLLYGEIPHGFLGDSVKLLDISNNNFSGLFSRFDFGHCRSLVSLSLSHNALSGTEFPSSLINCQVLETLDLSHNGIKSKIPGVLLSGLKRLRELFLGHNQFYGEIPNELGIACGSLVVLDLSENKLSGELPMTFGKCSSLQSLNLAKNYLSGDFLSSVVSKLSSLRYLYVPFNNITGPVPLSLANCTQLQVLDLSSNAFTGSIPSGFCICSSSTSPSALEKLLLAGNYLSGMVPAELGSFWT